MGGMRVAYLLHHLSTWYWQASLWCVLCF